MVELIWLLNQSQIHKQIITLKTFIPLGEINLKSEKTERGKFHIPPIPLGCCFLYQKTFVLKYKTVQQKSHFVDFTIPAAL